MKELIRVEVHVSGIVQGVGFRPFVYGLAHKHLLKGQDQRLNRVVLSGGVFQNLVLLQAACSGWTAAGFEVYTHGRVPTNDGGISLGQAAIANALIVRRGL